MTKTYELQSIPAQDSNRLLALDAVRGIAVIGMYIQHFALNERNRFVSGNTMILFILCSGISYTMMAQGMERRAMESPAFCARVLARSVFIDLAGYLILMLNGPFGVVLQAYAMLFLLALPLVKCSTKMLAAISAISFVVCPPFMLIGADPTAVAQFPMGDIVTVLFVLTVGGLLSLRKNGPLEAAVRKFEGRFYLAKGAENGTAD